MTASNDPRARRRFRRRTVRVLVDYATPDGARYEYATTLGAGGLFIQTDAPLARGQSLTLRFRLEPDAPLHEIPGRVKWVHDAGSGATRAPGMGIEFTDPAATATLARELDHLGQEEEAA